MKTIPEMRRRCALIRSGEAKLIIIQSNEAWGHEDDVHFVATMDDDYWIASAKTLRALMKELGRRKLPVHGRCYRREK